MEAERERERQTEIDREIDRDRETDRQTDRDRMKSTVTRCNINDFLLDLKKGKY